MRHATRIALGGDSDEAQRMQALRELARRLPPREPLTGLTNLDAAGGASPPQRPTGPAWR